MKFYYNKELGFCAKEYTVADYLYLTGCVNSHKEAIKELRNNQKFCGWVECQPLDKIK